MLVTRSRTFPLPSEQSIEIDFIENRDIDLNLTGRERKCTFDTERKKFVPQATFRETVFDGVSEPAIRLELQGTQDSLIAAIEKLKGAKGKSSTKIASFHISDAHCWNDVIKIVAEAEQDYLEDESLSGKVRKAFRRIGDDAKSIKPFINLLPDGNYKTLCGGLTLILTAMMKKAEYRDKVADILNELPLTIQECEDYTQIYPGKTNLRLRIEDLYIQLVGAIEDMIRWYTQKSLSRVTKSILKGDAYVDAIDNRIKAIKSSQDAFDREARKYLHWRTDVIDRTVVDTNTVARVINEDVVRIGRKVWESSYKLEDIEKAVKIQTKALNGVSDVLRDVKSNAEWLNDRKFYQQKVIDQEARIQELEMQLGKKIFRAETLAKRLHLAIPEDCHWSDLDVVLAAGAALSLKYQGQVKHVAGAEEFRSWFRMSESAVL
ncbi:hypothetical protein K491DRAFT_310216 [Lophiostoma macrostomum CBS 122681]|uniref:DUF7708 domain-containing protein n=1 Tax=Lophiostoma macrostomum CBS 122681 TaxID=1314788 RepID=A0A6A6SKA1_9PLEO|nr:hypothetical protein K491DRAFT_310216 [Lophiostoma macrostomum CBS 122681]